jgi:hypothetical protein
MMVWSGIGGIMRADETRRPCGDAKRPELDRTTTSPPWDPGHVVLGMELDAELRSSLGIATPKAGDCQLVAVARVVVPRALSSRESQHSSYAMAQSISRQLQV